MVRNATILRIDLPQTPDAAGRVAFSTGDAIAVRCAYVAPTAQEKISLDADGRESIAKLYLPMDVAALGGTAPAIGQRFTLQIDRLLSMSTYLVRDVETNAKGAASHWLLTLRAI